MNPQNFINNAIQNWLESHPRIDWVVEHPIGTLIIGVLILFLFWGLLNAIARFTEQFWLALLRLPLQLSQWIFRGSPKLLAGLFRLKPKEDSQTQLKVIVDRLEELRREEDQLIEQVRRIVASKN
ncbi:MAG: hypothetical protein K6T90_20730 [Leptolyngbyaceae cyanobacterium HOT.MB2.61]|nr:hypothetical protein [Leptolyngbyaceae cyanobacterium HOT.MB2.61]